MVLDLDLIVYLRTDPDVAYDRMRSRGRTEEAGAPLKYLQLLHEAYEDWLINQVWQWFPITAPGLQVLSEHSSSAAPNN